MESRKEKNKCKKGDHGHPYKRRNLSGINPTGSILFRLLNFGYYSSISQFSMASVSVEKRMPTLTTFRPSV